MTDAPHADVDAESESYEVDTPAGRATVAFPFDDELPPVYSGEPAAVIALHEAILASIGPTGAALSPDTLTPLALVEIIPVENAGIEVVAPSDFSEPEPAMSILDSARRAIQFPAALLDTAAAAKSVADLRRELAATGAGVMARLGLARALLTRFTAPNPDAGNDDEGAELAPRRATAQLYDFDDNRKPAQRKRENRAAEELLRQIDTGEVDAASLTDAQKSVLAKYSGLGGALVSADGKKGSAYEYYTPKPIAEGVWNLLAELGFTGGKVLDPSAGTGIFGATAPLSAAVDAVELSRVSGRINGLVNGGPGYTATIAPYEKVAAATPDEIYDAVVTNVPFGGVADRGGNNLLDPRYQNEPLQNYFVLRALEKLRPGGLAVFITPPRCVSGKGGKEEDLRIRASYMAEFLGAYRLPNSVFGTAAADTVTDVIAFRKYSRDVLEKIEELREQSPETLVEANVQWQTFISGRYFLEDGKRFILGEVQVGKGQWGDVERVVTTQPVGEVAKMLRRFPDSRVNWELLDATPTDPILYRDGDTITQAGQTLEMRGGQWHPLAPNTGGATAPNVASFLTPYAAFEADATFAQATDYFTYMVRASQSLDIPDWVRGTLRQLERLASDAERAKFWKAGVIGMAAQQVLQERMSEEVGVNYRDEYPALSEAMRVFAKVAKNRPGGLTGLLRDGLATITAHVRKDGFSDVWVGNVAAEVEAIDAGHEFAYEGIRYRRKSAWVPLEEAKGVYGEDFDPIASEQWCISADGLSVARADDFFVGNVKDVLEQLDRDIANAASDAIRAKLLWQKSFAATRYEKIDVRRLNYGWGSPFVGLSEKLEFARRYIHDSAYIDTNDKGQQAIKLDLPGSMKDTDKGKLLMRLSDYLARGTVSLSTAKFTMKPGEAMAELRRQVATVNQQFNGWVRGNNRIMDRMQATANDEGKLRFRQTDDETPLQIPGFKQALHGYQTAFVRKMGREFGGINGFDVGLGKTFTALAATQFAQAIGVKSKTAFVVPNSVLSNWRKEANKAFEDTSDCLFIGLREKNGKAVVNSKFYDEDLQAVLTNKHRKVFMTMEAFERIKLRAETVDAFQAYMAKVDRNFAETDDNKDEEIRKSKVAAAFTALREKAGAAPYLEDMGIDSVVIDEGHGYKNSVNTVDFKQAKFLSLPDPAKRGIDMQAKAWFIRGASPLRDGVLPLTATPITNSPLEIYSMLALAAGHDRVNDMCLGVQGADDFMEVMTQRDNIDDVTIDGEDRQTDVFTGLNNVEVLRNAISSVATIKGAADVGAQIQLPDGEELPTQVALPPATFDRLREYKDAFRFAVQSMIGAGAPDYSKQAAFDSVSAHFGEKMGTMANAFNLINKMELLILDPEMDQRATYYSFSKADEAKVARAVDQFNQKKRIEERPRLNPHTREEAVVSRKIVKDRESGKEVEILRCHVLARMIDGENRVLIDSVQPDAQTAFEDMVEKLGVELDVSIPPKLAALLENVRKEQASPRGIDDEGNYSPIVKQIIFCDRLGMMNKIKRVLVKHAGIAAGKIAIVTGQSNNEPDEILAVQDGFNAHGADNKYQIILANEKAEVGINLQKGTQAIHHLTIGWTPDSLTQRNGRGVRQGNKTGVVNVYYYDAEGTFDTYRRGMVNKKADWIESVLDSAGGNSVTVAGGLSDKQYEALVNSLGDNDAMSKIQREIDAAEAAERVRRTRSNQLINAETIIKNRALAAKLADPAGYIKDRIVVAFGMREDIDKLRDRIAAKGASETARAKNRERVADLVASADGLERDIEAACTITGGWPVAKVSVKTLFERVNGGYRKRGQSNTERLIEAFRSYEFAVVEGSTLHQEWQSELDMATGMAREAAENFARQSDETGGYAREVATALASGGGWVDGGKLFTVGSFVRDYRGDGNLLVFTAPDNAVNMNPAGGYMPTTRSEFGDLTPILPGTEDFDACVTLAAAIEDANATNGGTDTPFSEVVPEVSQRRKVAANARYARDQYRLPAPHFPFVIEPGERRGSRLKARILDEQQSVVRGVTYGYPMTFVVPGDLQVVQRAWQRRDLSSALVDYALAHGLQVEPEDFGNFYWADDLRQQIEARVPMADFQAALAGGDEPAIRAKAADFIRARLSWFAFPSDPLDVAPTAMKDAVVAAVRAVASTSLPTSPTAMPASDNEIVAITGNTMKWKDRIKAVAVSHGNGRFKWDGRASVWNVYRSTWTRLLANYPEAGGDLTLTKPTITKF